MINSNFNSFRIKKVLLLVLAFIIVLMTAYKVIPYEMRLRQCVNYEEVIMRYGAFSVLQSEDEDCILFVGYTPNTNPFAVSDKEELMHVRFNTKTRKVEFEQYSINSSSKWTNDFAENSRDIFAYRIYAQIERGTPKYNLYMGVSQAEPSYTILGSNVSELQYVERDGMYVFMFLEEFG